MDPFAILISLLGPFLVWPIEYLLPYPYIVEELFKCVVVWFGPKKASIYIYAGMAFALTETVFYAININMAGANGLMVKRFVITSILHSSTFLLIYFANKKSRKLLPIGFLAAATIHFLYNLYI